MLLKRQRLLTESEGDQRSRRNRVDTPLVTARAGTQEEMRMIIKENKELQKRLERAETAQHGLQLGYDQMDDRQRAAIQDLKLKESELAD